MIVLRNSEYYLKWEFKGFKEATSLPSKSIMWSCPALTVEMCAAFAKWGSSRNEAFFTSCYWSLSELWAQWARCCHGALPAAARLHPRGRNLAARVRTLGASPTGSTCQRRRRSARGSSSSCLPAAWRRLCVARGSLFVL